MTQHNLGFAYSQRIAGSREENLERAIAACEAALTIRTRDAFPQDWAGTQNNLGIAYSQRIAGSRGENLERAIAAYEAALTIRTRDAFPQDWAETQNNRGTAYKYRITGSHGENLERAIVAYEATLQVYTRDAFPTEYRLTLRNLGNLHFGEPHWDEAATAYQVAIAVGDDLLAAAPSEEGKQAEIGETTAMFVNLAFCLTQMGTPADAMRILERGKARLLAEALSLDDLRLDSLPVAQQKRIAALRLTIRELEGEYRLPTNAPRRRSTVALNEVLGTARRELSGIIAAIRADNADFMSQELALPELLALIPQGGALVAPLFTDQGSAVFIVPYGTQEVTNAHMLRLDGFKSDDLRTLLRGSVNDPEWGGWLGAYFNFRRGRNFPAWCAAMDDFTGQLWNKFVGTIYARLVEFGINQIIIMPQGGLGLLPIHAAWRIVDGQKRYLLDDIEVRYAPSGYALRTAQIRAAAHQQKSALVAGVSKYVNLNDLPNVPVEVESIAECFHTMPLLNAQTTRQAVIDQTPGKAYVHLSCHGNFAFGGVNDSALYLANDEPLTMTDILTRLKLDAARLVSLSACETGITDTSRNPDEFVGLPAAFMQAGAPGVVSTLWTVADNSTALLMEKFYRLHIKDGKPPATALREAQLWLRELTRRELGAYYEEIYMRMSPDSALDASIKLIQENGSPDDRLYAHPFYWAAFTYTGA
jgi:CHAT domain-containing protein/tetratricopeptide (TPR) repeat protein